MRIHNIVIAWLLAFLFLAPLSVQSQEIEKTDFDIVYEEYKLSFEPYQELHDDYVLKRAQYLRFKTQRSRDEAHEATLQMLQARDDVIVAYLQAVRSRLAEADGVSEDYKQEMYVNIDVEISWYDDHRVKMESALTLEDLVGDSKSARSRFSSVKSVAYKVLSLVSYGKHLLLKDRMDVAFSDLEDKYESIRDEEREEYKFDEEKLQVIDRWLVESSNHVLRSEGKKNEAIDKIVGPKSPGNFSLDIYNIVLGKLEESRLILKESGAFLKEVVRQIKTVQDYEQ